MKREKYNCDIKAYGKKIKDGKKDIHLRQKKIYEQKYFKREKNEYIFD